MDIAVCDDGGNLVAFERMDGALVGAIQIAIDKAYTSATCGIATAEEGNMAQPGGPEYGANTLCGGRIVILGGGIPIKLKNVTLGAVGCSSGAAEQDIAVADAGVRSLVEKLVNKSSNSCEARPRRVHLNLPTTSDCEVPSNYFLHRTFGNQA